MKKNETSFTNPDIRSTQFIFLLVFGKDGNLLGVTRTLPFSEEKTPDRSISLDEEAAVMATRLGEQEYSVLPVLQTVVHKPVRDSFGNVTINIASSQVIFSDKASEPPMLQYCTGQGVRGSMATGEYDAISEQDSAWTEL